MTTKTEPQNVTDERLAEMVGAGMPCVPIMPGEVAQVVQELRQRRALTQPSGKVSDEQVNAALSAWRDHEFDEPPMRDLPRMRAALEAAQLPARPVVPEDRLPTREEAAWAAEILLRCNGFDLDTWGGGDIMDDDPMNALKRLSALEGEGA